MKRSTKTICSRCVMDSSAEDIVFDVDGVCNYCTEFVNRAGKINQAPDQASQAKLAEFLRITKEKHRHQKYDCIVGLSGGVDSSYVLIKAIEFGLRPLAVHMDNGWNSELAQNNIANLVKKLDVDLITHVIDWSEYRSLMQCFFNADVVDVELLYDNAMLAVNYQIARRFDIKTILGGTNQSTEGLKIPKAWNNLKFDRANIEDIARKHGFSGMSTFPAIGLAEWLKFEYVDGIKWVHFLDMFEYKKDSAISMLVNNYKYKPYPHKHYESIFTRFYQGYLLIRKFGVDKRKVHFSSLILTDQLSRDKALKDLRSEYAYEDEFQLKRDIKYFLKKMMWSASDLEGYLARPPVAHSQYKTSRTAYDILIKIYRLIRRKS